MRHKLNNTRDIKSVTPGTVIGINTSLGAVQIYDSMFDETITYMHLSSWNVSLGDTISVGQVIGKQGDKGASGRYHLHFQAYDGNSTYLAPASDMVLQCRLPYGFMTWYI